MSYFNLADQNEVNLYLSPFLGWGFTNGFNFQSSENNKLKSQGRLLIIQFDHFSGATQVVPDRVAKIGYSHSFLSNMNVMLVVLFLEFLISIILILMSQKIKCLKRIASILFK